MLLLLTCLLLIAAAPLAAQTGFGTPQELRHGWLFRLADDSTFLLPATDDTRWQRVSVPHDWGVTRPMSPDAGSCQGFLHGGVAWYRHHLTLRPGDLDGGRRVYIYFEGVYNRSTVYVNGHCLGHRPSGFSSFIYDLTPHLRPAGDNVLAVRVDHSRENDARWYTGSGIYRPVWLVKAPPTHFALWGTAWQLRTASAARAEIDVTAQVAFTAPAAAVSREGYAVAAELVDADGRVVATATTRKLQPLAPDSDGAPDRCQAELRLAVTQPRMWSPQQPNLYALRMRLLGPDGEPADAATLPVGLRTLRFDPDRGFAINGEWTKVKGVCLHDDAGVLGTAVPPEVWRWRLMQLKSLGVNAIRMSHNPHAPALYALCDTLGLLVMDEASDEWEFPKRKWLEGWNKGIPGFQGTFDYFEEWIERDVADMVRRDRCHPSIFLWSIGNEVDYPNDPYSHPILDGDGADFTQPIYGGYQPTQPNAERIGYIAKRLADVVRRHDTSRPTTGALAGVVMSNQTAYPEAVDVVGYNYTESRYAEDHRRYPKRVIYGSENRHDLAAWRAVSDNAHIFGQFLWTGIDYLGESGPWPARGSEAGLLNLAGDIKPNGHYRAALWATQPVCYIGAYPRNAATGQRRRAADWVSPYAPAVWNFRPGQPVRVVCYTNASNASLTLNGAPVGGEPARDADTGILYWDIDYAPGTLRAEAVGFDHLLAPKAARQEPPVATAVLTTTGRPAALRATTIVSGEVSIIRVEVVDDEGRRVTLADNEVECHTRGGARLLGLENGNIRDTALATEPRRCVSAGTLVAYVRRAGRGEVQRLGADGAAPVVVFSSPLLGAVEVAL